MEKRAEVNTSLKININKGRKHLQNKKQQSNIDKKT